jgi:hypothetical protein
MYHYPGNDIMNGSLLTVPAHEVRVRKMREVIADRQRYVEIS